MEELSRAVSAGVGHIVADSFGEIARLAYLTDPSPGGPPPGPPSSYPGGAPPGPPSSYLRGHSVPGDRPQVLVRAATGVGGHTHARMSTRHDDAKVGLSLASGAAHEA